CTRKRTDSAATSTPVTGARARQPGTAFTSRTYQVPSGPGSRSTPARDVPTAWAACRASCSSSADSRTISPRPPWATLVRQAPLAKRRIAASARPPRTKTRRSQPGWRTNCCRYRTHWVRSRVQKVRQASSGSDTRTMPRPSEPNSGLTTTSPPQRRERLQRALRGLAGGRWPPRQARRLQSRGSEVLVHAHLQRPRRVEHGHAAQLQAVQHVHAKDDLLQRSWRHCPHDRSIEAGQQVRGASDGGTDAAEV